MIKPKQFIATTLRVLLHASAVMAVVLLAGLIGVGGAALWIYARPQSTRAVTRHFTSPQNGDLAADVTRRTPILTTVQADESILTRLTPVRYVPTESEIATLSDSPRYTYISYNGGRQQAHLRVNTVLSASVPAPLDPPVTNDEAAASTSNRPVLSDPTSRYITDASGRIIGIDGTAGAAAEANPGNVAVTRASRVQSESLTDPEVRVASPVITRKALPVADEDAPPTDVFNVEGELSRDDDRPVLPAQAVIRNPRHALMFGTSGTSPEVAPD